jgi:hypothetical protein
MSQEVGSPASFGVDIPTEGDDLEAEVRESLRESPVTNPGDLMADSGERTQADAERAGDDGARDAATRNDDRGASEASEGGSASRFQFPNELLGGLGVDADRGESSCKRGGSSPASLSAPWRGTQRDGDKQSLADYVARNGEAKPLSRIVRDVFGKESVAGDDADYQLARRFFARYSEAFRVMSTGDLTYIEPKVGLLRQRNVKRKNARRGDDDRVTVETGGETGDDRRYPKELVRSFLGLEGVSGTKQIKTEGNHRSIFKQFASWRESIDGTFSRFDSYRDRAPADHLLVETESRFNSVAEAQSYDRLTESLDLAAESHDDGILLTLTPQPVRFDSHADMAESLRDGVSNLKSWLQYRFGFSPDSIRVLEYQRRGQPHYHVALFGVSGAGDIEGTEPGTARIAEAEVREYWDETRDLGTQVDIRPIRRRNDAWILHDDDRGRVSLSYYLGKAPRRIRKVAGTDAGDLMDRFDAGDLDWRVALYWAYGRQARVVTRSPSLRESTGDDLAPIKKWEYVGTARLEEMPQSVVRRAIVRTASGGAIPPPSGTGATAEAGAPAD